MITPAHRNAPFPWDWPLKKKHDPQRLDDRFESPGEANRRLADMIRLMARGGLAERRLALQLEPCTGRRRCGLPCCPVCWRRFRRAMASSVGEMLEREGWKPDTGWAVTAVPSWAATASLANFDIRKANDRVRAVLVRSAMRDAAVIGGWDFSYNSHGDNQWQPHWQPHLYLIFPFVPASAPLVSALSKAFVPSPTVKKPLKVKKLSSPVTAVTYAFKGMFFGRSSYVDASGALNSNVKPLKPREQREIVSYLSTIGMTDRCFTRWVRRYGSRLMLCQRGRLK